MTDAERRARPAGSEPPAPGGSGAPTVLIVGATSGIMRAVAAEFAARGSDLVLLARDRDELEAVAADLRLRYGVATRTGLLDALAFEDHEPVLDACLAGVALAGAVVGLGYLGDQRRAESDFGEARRIIDVNFTACVSLLSRIADHLERRQAGFICVLSSVAGERGRQSNYVYGAAKAGLSTYLQGLRNRLHHAGVRVTTVLPGFVDTSMTYGKPGLFLVAPPERVARGIYRAAAAGRDIVYLPGWWRLIMRVIRGIPERVFKRLRL